MPALTQSRWKTLIECLRSGLAALGETVRSDWQDPEDVSPGITVCYGKRRTREKFRAPAIIVYPVDADIKRALLPLSASLSNGDGSTSSIKKILDRALRVAIEIHTDRDESNIPTLEQDRLIDNVWCALWKEGFLPNNIDDATVGELFPTEQQGSDIVNTDRDVAVLTFLWDQPVVYTGPSGAGEPENVVGLNQPVTEITTPTNTDLSYVESI